MTLTQKLVLYALAIALVPLAATGFTLVHESELALRDRIMAHQRTAADGVAATLAQAIDELGERAITAMTLVDPLTLGPRGRQGLLRLLHRQSASIDATVLLDADGKLLAYPVAEDVAEPDAATLALGRWPAAPTDRASTRLVAHVPSLASFSGKSLVALVSAPYFDAQGPAHIAMGASCCAGADGRAQALAGIELSLQAATLKTGGIDTGPGSRLFVVDAQGHVLAHPAVAVGESLAEHAAVAAFLRERTGGTARYAGDGGVWVAAYAPVGALGWAAVIEQPETLAFAQAASLRQRTLAWMAVTTGLVLLTGLWFAGRVRRRILALVTGARAFGAGRLGERLPASVGDEIGELGGTMNAMAEQLAKSLAELEEWNRTLEAKVEQRTQELRQTQAHLLTQSKLAAIGQLGAGVAHEVNNPLASILGYSQLLLRKHAEADGEHTSLKKIEEAAQRCKAITMNLLRFSQRSQLGRSPVTINAIVDEVLELLAGGLAQSNVQVERSLAANLPDVTADAGQVSLVLINLVSNARNAMPKGGVLRVATAASGDGVSVSVADTGHGIDGDHLPRLFEPFFTTKRVWTGVGLGLAVAYRIVTDHGGRIDVESKVGEGSRFTVVLPKEPPPLSAEEARQVTHSTPTLVP